MPWIIEIKYTIPVMHKGVHRDPLIEWRAMHPTGGPRYEYATREEASKMRGICYPDAGPDTVRIREV